MNLLCALKKAEAKKTGGIGLGLAIARSIIHAHGGTITLSNVAGTGLRGRSPPPERELICVFHGLAEGTPAMPKHFV